MSRTPWWLLFLLVTGCGESSAPIPATDLLLRVHAGADAVVSGVAFPLTVERIWEKSLTPAAWRTQSLAPLVLKLEGTERREDGARVHETLHYRAYAFSRSDVRIPPVVFEARTAGGDRRVARSDRFRVRVQPSVDAKTPGPAELPDLPSAPPATVWWRLVVALLATLMIVGVFLARLRRVPTPAPSIAPSDDVGARARLRTLEAQADAGSVDRVIAAADIVRDHLAQTRALPARERTTTELLGVALPGIVHAPLAALLTRADAVKYGGLPPDVAGTFRDAHACLDALHEGGTP